MAAAATAAATAGAPAMGAHGPLLYKKLAADLSQPVTDANARLALVGRVNDSAFIAAAQTAGHFGVFLELLVPALGKLLSLTNSPNTSADVGELRHAVLEVYVRLPNNDAKTRFARSIMHAMTSVLEKDRERNALLAFKIMRSLFSAFTAQLDSYASTVFTFIKKMYTSVGYMVDARFGAKAKKTATPFVRGRDSFKVLNELPRMTLTLMKNYPAAQGDAFTAIGTMMAALPFHPPAQAAAATQGTELSEFAQSHMTMLSSLFSLPPVVRMQTLAKYSANIVKCLVYLLRCPTENVAMRKKLLYLARVFMGTSVARGFGPNLDALLDERTLIGHSPRLHPLDLAPLQLAAYITMAEVVRQPQVHLTLQQITRVMIVFSRNVHNCSMATSIQKVSLRALLNLVKKINMHIEQLLSQSKVTAETANTAEQCRHLLNMILRTVVGKVEVIRDTIPRLRSECAALADFKPADFAEWYLRRHETRLQPGPSARSAPARRARSARSTRSERTGRRRVAVSGAALTSSPARSAAGAGTSAATVAAATPSPAAQLAPASGVAGGRFARQAPAPEGNFSIDSLLGQAPVPAPRPAVPAGSRSRTSSFSGEFVSASELMEADEDGASIQCYYKHLFSGKSLAGVVCMDDKDAFSRPDVAMQKLIKDLRDFLREMVDGLNTVVYCVGRVTTRDSKSTTPPAELLLRLHRAVMSCYELFDIPDVVPGSSDTATPPQELKTELMRSHASVFCRTSTDTFRDVISLEIDGLFVACHADAAFRSFFEFVLQEPKTAVVLIDVALKHLVDQFAAMAESPERGIKRMHHTVFQDILGFPEVLKKAQAAAAGAAGGTSAQHHNRTAAYNSHFEQLLDKYLFPLLTNLLNMALRGHSAPQALQLLTLLIRSVSTSQLLLEKFEKHISPIVTCFMSLYDRTASERVKERLLTLCILCLIMPTRKIYVRDLPAYLRPVVLSLSLPQFTKVAIRIVMWWVDLVSPDQLYKVLRNHPMLDLLGHHLFRLVKDNDSRHCSTVLRLLGKLGGRNRLFLEKQQRLNFDTSPLFASMLQVGFEEGSGVVTGTGGSGARCWASAAAAAPGAPFRVVLECNHILKYAISYLHRHFRPVHLDTSEEGDASGSGGGAASTPGTSASAQSSQSSAGGGAAAAAAAAAADRARVRRLEQAPKAWFSTPEFPSDERGGGGGGDSDVSDPGASTSREHWRRASELTELHSKLDSWHILRSGFFLLFRQYQERKRAGVPAGGGGGAGGAVEQNHHIQNALSRTLESIFTTWADADLRHTTAAFARHTLRFVAAWAISSDEDMRSARVADGAVQWLQDDIQTIVCRPVLATFVHKEPTLASLGFNGIFTVVHLAGTLFPAVGTVSSVSPWAAEAGAAAAAPTGHVQAGVAAARPSQGGALSSPQSLPARRSCFSRSLADIRAALHLQPGNGELHGLRGKEAGGGGHWFLPAAVANLPSVNRLLEGFVDEAVHMCGADAADAVLEKSMLLLVGLCTVAGPAWTRRHHLKLMQALFFMAGKFQNTVPAHVLDAVQVALEDLLVLNFAPRRAAVAPVPAAAVAAAAAGGNPGGGAAGGGAAATAAAAAAATPTGSMLELAPLLCEHLVSVSKSVRAITKRMLLQVAQLRSTSVFDIIMRHLPLFRLAVLPPSLLLHTPAKQCAILDALQFAASLNARFLGELNSGLFVQLISDALRITAGHTPKPYVPRLPTAPPAFDRVDLCRHRHVFDLKDQIEAVRRRNRAQKHDTLPAVDFPLVLQAEFRLSVLRLSSLLLRTSFASLSDKEKGQLREYFVRVVRGSLESKVSEIMRCALDCFVDVVRSLSLDKATTAVSKELLSKCLDPILHHLTDYRQLSLTLLLQLRFLLQAMKRRFNAQIVGGALLGHLSKWLDPAAIMRSDCFHRGEEVLIASRLLGLFHLLPEFPVQQPTATAPPGASAATQKAYQAQNAKASLHERRRFMDDVITTVARLEHEVPKFNDRTRGSYSKLTSPFRHPLYQ